MDKTIREICLLCKGERWVEDPLKAGQSKACGYCDATGWVLVAEANFSPEKTELPSPAQRKAD